jgi:hypothetical protein
MSEVLFWRDSDEFTAGQVVVCCPRCEYSLTIHQPDPDLPNRLLATCDECKSWFSTDSDVIAMAFMPDRFDDRAAEGLAG